MFRWVSCALVAALSLSAAEAGPRKFEHGRAATSAEIAAWDIDVRPDGAGLPPGAATASQGEVLYQELCAACHGDFGEGSGRWPPLAGDGELTAERPVKTVGNYWPSAPVLFDYIRRTMPFGKGMSLGDRQTYALTAYVLYLNDLVAEDAIMDRDSLPKVKMPNRDGFLRVGVAPPDVNGTRCLSRCRTAPVRVLSRQRPDVTPK